jgi:hypothetical protein
MSYRRVAVDSTTWRLKGGEEVGYDGFSIVGDEDTCNS